MNKRLLTYLLNYQLSFQRTDSSRVSFAGANIYTGRNCQGSVLRFHAAA